MAKKYVTMMSVVVRREDEAATKAAKVQNKDAAPVMRRVYPEIGKTFEYDEDEARDLLAQQPGCLEEPTEKVGESAVVYERGAPPAVDPNAQQASPGTAAVQGATQAANGQPQTSGRPVKSRGPAADDEV